jgi:poly(3-hydroxybutyrate) depolymerase
VFALIVVVAGQAANNRRNTATTTTVTTTPGQTTAPGQPTTSTSTRSKIPTVTSACASIPEPFPLAPRSCTIVSPPNVKAGEKLPVVIALHGFATDADQMRGVGQWDAAVVKDRFIAVFPQGELDSWNAGGCCGLAKSGNVDDVGYLQTVLTALRQRPDVDPSRIYMVGASNGGMMTYLFLCSHADELAGAASISGTSVVGCEPNAPIRFLHVHGTADTTVPYDGGQSLISWVLGVTFTSATHSAEQVAKSEGCGAPSTQTQGVVTTETWTGCGTGGPVQMVSLAGWGHTWPTGTYDATAQILKFFGLTS